MTDRIIGQIVSHYRVLAKLGEGGMGVVHKAEDIKLKRPVALKFLPMHLSLNPERRNRFVHEAKTASNLDHPNICTIYEIDETSDGQTFIAMAYYDGQTLKDLIRRGRLPVDQAVNILTQLAQGLSKAHASGVVHRDIKPANIILTDDGLLKILDFGLAQIISGEATRMTAAGQAVGTPAYMSPEQANGSQADHRSDIWSAGVVAYEMLTGDLPFRGDHPQALFYAILNKQPELLRDRNNDVSPEFEKIINTALAKRPDDRYQDVQEFLRDLQAISRGVQPEIATRRTTTSIRLARSMPALAVLPFENLTGDKENEFFSDGLTEELINSLAHVEGLRVVARTSAFEFKGKAQDIRRVGERLSVSGVVEGSVRRAGNRVRIMVQLIDVANGFQMWSQRYDRQLEDVFDVQDEIARTIVEQLKIQLRASDMGPVIKRYTDNLDAYQAYMKGRFYWNKRTVDSLSKAIDCFNNALEMDPLYSLAYTGLADYHSLLAGYGFAPAVETWSKAEAAAMKAIELDDSLAEPHVSLGAVRMFCEWNWIEAEKEYQLALAMNPASLDALFGYGCYLAARGRLQEALSTIRRARERDPLSVALSSIEAMFLTYQGDYDKAIDRCHQAMEMQRDSADLHYALGLAYQQKGAFDEAIDAFEKGVEESGRSALLLGWLGNCYATAGRKAEAGQIIEQLNERSKVAHTTPISWAVIYAGLGEKDLAFEWLEKSVEARDAMIVYVNVVPTYAPLRADPRYDALVRRIGLRSVSFTSVDNG